MKATFKISWRNIWRNPLRSFVVIFAIALGVLGSLFAMGFMNGMMDQFVNNRLNTHIGKIQIHSKTHDFEPDISNTIQNHEELIQSLEQNENVKAYTDRFMVDAFASSARGQKGITLLGVEPKKESDVLLVYTKFTEGTFLESEYKYPVAIGYKLADELKLSIGSSMIIQFVKPDSTLMSKKFKVCGIFKSGDSKYDETTVYIPKEKAWKLAGQDGLIHEIVVGLKDDQLLNETTSEIADSSPENLVQSYIQRFPEMAYSIESMDMMMYIFMIIIILALLFGVINTLVMSILERKREIGVLLAIGMTKSKIRTMIAIESVIYGIIGGPLGMVFGYLLISYFGSNGMDLSGFSQGMEAYGMESVIYFQLPTQYYFIYAFLIFIASIIGALYPARIATRMNPIKAIRSV